MHRDEYLTKVRNGALTMLSNGTSNFLVTYLVMCDLRRHIDTQFHYDYANKLAVRLVPYKTKDLVEFINRVTCTQLHKEDHDATFNQD